MISRRYSDRKELRVILRWSTVILLHSPEAHHTDMGSNDSVAYSWSNHGTSFCLGVRPIGADVCVESDLTANSGCFLKTDDTGQRHSYQ